MYSFAYAHDSSDVGHSYQITLLRFLSISIGGQGFSYDQTNNLPKSAPLVCE